MFEEYDITLELKCRELEGLVRRQLIEKRREKEKE